MKRRDFLSGLAITSATLAARQTAKGIDAAPSSQSKAPTGAGGGKIVMISAANGIPLNPDGTPAGLATDGDADRFGDWR